MSTTYVRAATAVLGAVAIALAAASGSASATVSTGTDTVLGPDGFGPLKVGMSLSDAIATGKVGDPVGGHDLCRGYKWAYSSGPVLIISKKYGVYSIPGTAPGARTPEGIGVGATPEQVKLAYPNAREGKQNGTDILTVTTPGNPANRYLFGVRDGKVSGFALQAVNARDCAAG
ncbi:hypothetical protein [Allokutzneria oryzae]|uniref:Secreted protein n=1 Tax=Allokutzneria oryzae TaxID=1378989 RepID=A0ABV6A7L9_9PSEU